MSPILRILGPNPKLLTLAGFGVQALEPSSLIADTGMLWDEHLPHWQDLGSQELQYALGSPSPIPNLQQAVESPVPSTGRIWVLTSSPNWLWGLYPKFPAPKGFGHDSQLWEASVSPIAISSSRWDSPLPISIPKRVCCLQFPELTGFVVPVPNSQP